jgi:2-polyprenyl-3-methyl-5-hydroxy-6-metoxy-1,4-benzoquinol methylase
MKRSSKIGNITWDILVGDKYQHRYSKLANLSYGKTLEVGPGQGAFMLILLNQGIDVIGLDISEQCIRAANDMFRLNGIGTTIHHGTIYHLPFEDNSFDTVVCSECLEHLKWPLNAMRELARVTRKHLYTTVPNKGAMPPGQTRGHIQDFSISNMACLFKGAGLRILKMEIFEQVIYTIGIKK